MYDIHLFYIILYHTYIGMSNNMNNLTQRMSRLRLNNENSFTKRVMGGKRRTIKQRKTRIVRKN